MKTVLITGCSSGFGRDLVPEYLKRGWNVIATLRKAQERLELFADSLNAHPKQLTVFNLDVTQKAQREQIGKLIETQFGGKLDCLVNNAGYGLFGALEDLSEAQIRDEMEVNFFGLTLLTQELLPFLRRTQGKIINVSSVLGYAGLPLASLYCASKYAVEGLSESLYYELKTHGVQVALVEPGGYSTGFGDKSNWGVRSFQEESAYFQLSKSYKQVRNDRLERQRTSEKGKEKEVSVLIANLSEMKKMPLRNRTHREAHLLHYIKKLLPGKLSTLIFSFAYGRLLRRANR